MVKRINLALQGGGAHGAFTWGVLDRLLQEDDLEITAISGTSAGALNGAALKAGMATASGAEGRQAARDNLDWLWAQVGTVTDDRVIGWLNTFFPDVSQIARLMELSPPFIIGDAISRTISPYTYGQGQENPLRRIVDQFKFENVCCDTGPELFINTTRVRNGKIRVFSHAEITTDVILASACLPTVFPAVEFYDTETERVEAFWDGGYTGNPALFPMFEKEFAEDIIVININPLEREVLPRSAVEIQNRINEISFNSSLLRELRAIHFVQRLVEDGQLSSSEKRSIKIHMISDDALMNDLSVATKMIPTPVLQGRLKSAGQAAASTFLDTHKDSINKHSTVDLPAMFG